MYTEILLDIHQEYNPQQCPDFLDDDEVFEEQVQQLREQLALLVAQRDAIKGVSGSPGDFSIHPDREVYWQQYRKIYRETANHQY
jgi:hypothetical protein